MLHEEDGLDGIFTSAVSFTPDQSTLGTRVKDKVSIAKGSLLLDLPFFGYVLSHYNIIPTLDKISKYAIDTQNIYINSHFANDIIQQDNWKGTFKGILIHLIHHIFFKHIFRQGSRDPKLWAYACDITIFHSLTDIRDNWITPPDWILPSTRLIPTDLLGHSVERTYELLVDLSEHEETSSSGRSADNEADEPNNPNPDLVNFTANEGSLLEAIGLKGYDCDFDQVTVEYQDSGLPAEIEEQFLSGLIQTAYQRQEQFGNLPGDLERKINDLYSGQIHWRSKLNQYLQNTITMDLAWTRPNKRLYGQGYVLPGPLKENITILLGLDTSGSISDSQLIYLLSECQQLLQSISNVRLIIADCDTQIQQIMIYEAGETLVHHTPKGGGGTDFRPVFDLESTYTPDLIIYITDGDGFYPKKSPVAPVIWVLTEEKSVPFGDRVFITT